MSLLKAVAPALVGGVIDAFSTNSANKANVRMAREQMAFQERMSSTEVQRRVADLKAAGLNPMLAYGGAASSPEGARAQVEPVTRNTAQNLSSAFGNAVQAQQVQNLSTQNQALALDVERKRMENEVYSHTVPWAADRARFQQGLLEANVQKVADQIRSLRADTDLTLERLKQGKLTTAQMEKIQPILLEIAKIQATAAGLGIARLENIEDFEKKIGEAGPWMYFLLNMARGFSDVTR